MTQVFITNRHQSIPRAASAVKPYELELSLFVVVVLCALYIAYEMVAEPGGGTGLMVMTELLYSLRKRTGLLNWAGPVRYWLSFHIFTGIVGPTMVLMHTALEFRGLAGITMLLTTIVVGSGFIGRYLYTALPRTLTGVTKSRQEIESEIITIQASLTQLEAQKPEQVRRIVAQLRQRSRSRSPLLTLYGRAFFQWRYRRRVRKALHGLKQLEVSQRKELTQFLNRQRELERQTEMLETARRLLRSWHILHVPIGLTLFFSIAIHTVATMYFGAGLFN
jgi:hypothetical protein